MKMLFSMDDQVHHFKAIGVMTPEDLVLLKQSLFRFFETKPSYTVVDLSELNLEVTDFELQSVLNEIKTHAHAKALYLGVALTDIEAIKAKQNVLEAALLKQVDVLKAKIELRARMRQDLESLLEENQELKKNVAMKLDQIKSNTKESKLLHPIVEKLWSEP